MLQHYFRVYIFHAIVVNDKFNSKLDSSENPRGRKDFDRSGA